VGNFGKKVLKHGAQEFFAITKNSFGILARHRSDLAVADLRGRAVLRRQRHSPCGDTARVGALPVRGQERATCITFVIDSYFLLTIIAATAFLRKRKK